MTTTVTCRRCYHCRHRLIVIIISCMFYCFYSNTRQATGFASSIISISSSRRRVTAAAAAAAAAPQSQWNTKISLPPVLGSSSSSSSSSTTTTLSAVSTAAASSICWFGSALLGYWVEKHWLPESGILVTLAISALTVQSPTPALNELCWNTFLPASLALLLLSLRDNNNNNIISTASNRIIHKDDDKLDRYSIPASIRRLAIPFVLASLGSILGCILSFWICQSFYSLSSSSSSSALPWLLNVREARVALSCLAASFVGGSVNFFATANFISATAATTTTMSIVSSMAASDIVVMAIYFALIGSALTSDKLRSFFGTRYRSNNNNSSNITTDTPDTPTKTPKGSILPLASMDEDANDATDVLVTETSIKESLLDWRSSIPAALLASTMAWCIVRFSSWMEKKLEWLVPGLACGVIATLTLLLKRNLRRVLNRTRQEPKEQQHQWFFHLQRVSKPLSQVSFLLLFSSIGSTADWSQATRSGLACLTVSLIALMVHFVVTFAGSVGLSRLCHHHDMELEDILVASNAAIGGPATAAAFCGRISPGRRRHRSLEGITYAATFWGVVGYAVGTTIGVFVYRFLGWMMQGS